MKPGIFLLLGTNLGDRDENLKRACEGIEGAAGKILTRSSIYRTAAWGKTDQPDFYNQVLQIDTPLEPEALLQAVLTVEEQLGRIREEKWGARLIDIDILLYHTLILHSPQLILPHPQLALRRFTLAPLMEIASDIMHPLLKKTVRELLAECPDQLPVEVLRS